MKAAPTARSTRTSSSMASPTTSRRTWPNSKSWAAPRPTTTTHRMGHGLQHAVQDVEALRVQRWHQRPLHRVVAQGHQGQGEVRTNTTTPSTWSPPSWMRWVEPPETIKGHVQSPFDGVSMRYSFDTPKAPTPGAHSSIRCSVRAAYGMTDGRRSPPIPPSPGGATSADTWELYHTDIDRSELQNLAAQEPERVQAMMTWARRGRCQRGIPSGRPLAHRDPHRATSSAQPRPQPLRLLPGGGQVPESQTVNIRNRSYSIGALVDIPSPVPVVCSSPTGHDSTARAIHQGQPPALHLQLPGHGRAKGGRRRRSTHGENLILSASFERR